MAFISSLLLSFACISASQASFPKDFEPANFECVPYQEVLKNVLTEASATHFAINPSIIANDINPSEMTMIEDVFRAYYGDFVTTERFQTALYDIIYADPGTHKIDEDVSSESFEHDKLKLRALVQHLAVSTDYYNARRKFGALIVRSLTDILDESWHVSRCVARYEQTNAESIIWNEVYK